MRGLGIHRFLLASTAVALVLTLAPVAEATQDTTAATPATEAARDATATTPLAVPVPEPANVPPPSRADINPADTPAEPQLDIKSLTGKDLIKAPLSTKLSAEDTAVADRLRDLLAARIDRFISRKHERQAVEAFYRDRGFAPLWVDKGAPSGRALAAIAYLRGVDADGLEPADYPAPDFKSGDAKSGDAGALAEAELRYTDTLLAYARHAQTGRMHFSRMSADVFYQPEMPDPADLLGKLASNRDLRTVLDGYQPQHPQYKALKAKLAEARKRTEQVDEVVRVPDGPTLKPGMKDARVIALRKRLKAPGNVDDTAYDNDLAEAVKDYQTGAGLHADGFVGPATLRHLNGGAQRRERTADIIVANMERWRWVPRDLGKAHVVLNIPDFTLRVFKDGATVWKTKVVVGKPSTPTPILSETMKFITVNPTWNVPPSIIANEYLPALRQDPTVLDRMGLKIEQNKDGTVRIYQPPGDKNALGRIRFNFPNKFLVYQHDTPDKHLFEKDVRAYSHGCMRVQDPLKYGEVLLSLALPKEGYTQDKLRRMFGGAEVNINFPTHIPVHITYQTAFVDDGGNLQVRDDLYGRDARMIAVLKGEERKVADAAVARPHSDGISKDALRYQVREESIFADWFQSQRGHDPRDPRRGRVSARHDPVAEFFQRLFR
jgi:murein L,D-transpeptidase YcbB/YkuD